ncbi:hypothetical protein, partial [Actinomadura geliboluensis]|uniref:hypothetical protein n=1 Tax=Actinomadura geliboluensis TaxID=882440 RepID=UPI00197AB94A
MPPPLALIPPDARTTDQVTVPPTARTVISHEPEPGPSVRIVHEPTLSRPVWGAEKVGRGVEDWVAGLRVLDGVGVGV